MIVGLDFGPSHNEGGAGSRSVSTELSSISRLVVELTPFPPLMPSDSVYKYCMGYGGCGCCSWRVLLLKSHGVDGGLWGGGGLLSVQVGPVEGGWKVQVYTPAQPGAAFPPGVGPAGMCRPFW